MNNEIKNQDAVEKCAIIKRKMPILQIKKPVAVQAFSSAVLLVRILQLLRLRS